MWRIGLALLAVAGLASTPNAAASERDAALEALIAEIDTVRRGHEVAGVALTLVTPDEVIWSGALGLADVKTQRPVSPETLFRIGSVTKAFTALALLMLDQQGELSLDTPLKQVAPDASLNNPWDDTRPVRIAHLLEHTAGLLDITRAEFDHNEPQTLEQALAFMPEARTSHWPPGMHSSYSNAGAAYAAYALEQITGQRYEAFVEQNVFRPLAMHSASFFLDAPTRQHLATGYDRDGVTVIPYWHMIFRPFGAINVKPREMAGFVQLLLNDGRVNGRRLLSPAAIRRMETPRTSLAAHSGLAYGYGLGNYQYVHEGFLFHGHGGDADGYLAHYAYNRDSARGYFVVINAFNGEALAEMRDLIEDYIVRDLRPRAPAPGELDEAVLARLTGLYGPVTRRFPWTPPETLAHDRLEVILDRGTLFTRNASGAKRPLLPVNAWHFRRPGEPVATIAFIENGGELYLQGDFGNYRRLGPTD